MKISALFLAAAVAIVGSAPASALSIASDNRAMICYNFGISQHRCINLGSNPQKSLHDAGYPDKIVVRTQRHFKVASSGWTTKGNCYRLADNGGNIDQRISLAKFLYCEANQRGFTVDKPKVVLGR